MSIQTLINLTLLKLLTPDEVAAILGVTPATLSVWRSTGRYPLPYVKSGGRVMYRPEDLEAFIKLRTINGQTSETTGSEAKTEIHAEI
ncbi:MAG: helix-turn-helix domain-containing protein [Methylobacter sp.]